MYIEISKDIIELALDSKARNSQVCAELLYSVALGARLKKHFYSIPYITNQAIKQRVSTRFPDIARIINGLWTPEYNTIRNQLELYMVISLSGETHKENNIIYYNPTEVNSAGLELHEESHFLCENLNDCKFYNLIAEDYQRRNRQLSRSKMAMLHRNGGGSTMAGVLLNELSSRNHLCLVIADSDKTSPTQIEIGKTAQSIEDAFTETPNSLSHKYILQTVREAENLIPKNVLSLSRSANSKSRSFINQIDYSYFDVKDGLRLSQLFKDHVYNHWTQLLNGLGYDLSQRNSIKSQSESEKDYKTRCEKSDNQIVKGWGSTILDQVITATQLKAELKKSYPKLSTSQKTEWDTIGRLLFSWTIANHKIS